MTFSHVEVLVAMTKGGPSKLGHSKHKEIGGLKNFLFAPTHSAWPAPNARLLRSILTSRKITVCCECSLLDSLEEDLPSRLQWELAGRPAPITMTLLGLSSTGSRHSAILVMPWEASSSVSITVEELLGLSSNGSVHATQMLHSISQCSEYELLQRRAPKCPWPQVQHCRPTSAALQAAARTHLMSVSGTWCLGCPRPTGPM